MRKLLGIAGALWATTCLLAALSNACFAAGAEAALKFNQTPTNLTLRDGDRTVLEYRYGEVPFKPYASQLVSPKGVQILRDSPHDHKHHHGLMFAVGADGVNFWEEVAKCGREVHREFGTPGVSNRNGMSVATFGEQLDWTGPTQGLLLREARKLAFYRGAGLDATLVTWSTRLEPAADKSEVKLGGSHYYGMGMRFVESMDKVGTVLWADSKESQTVGGSRVTRSAWCAYRASVGGKPVTVAVFDHPANPRHPARMFSMTTPFAYLSATLYVWKEPLVVTKDRPLAVRYGVAVWDSEKSAAEIRKLYERWIELESQPSAK